MVNFEEGQNREAVVQWIGLIVIIQPFVFRNQKGDLMAGRKEEFHFCNLSSLPCGHTCQKIGYSGDLWEENRNWGISGSPGLRQLRNEARTARTTPVKIKRDMEVLKLSLRSLVQHAALLIQSKSHPVCAHAGTDFQISWKRLAPSCTPPLYGYGDSWCPSLQKGGLQYLILTLMVAYKRDGDRLFSMACSGQGVMVLK